MTSMKVAPMEMKAPAMTASTKALTTSVPALVSATRSFLSSIDAGVIAPLYDDEGFSVTFMHTSFRLR